MLFAVSASQIGTAKSLNATVSGLDLQHLPARFDYLFLNKSDLLSNNAIREHLELNIIWLADELFLHV